MVDLETLPQDVADLVSEVRSYRDLVGRLLDAWPGGNGNNGQFDAAMASLALLRASTL